MDGSIITHPKIWEASGHTESFTDVCVDCKECEKVNMFDEHELEDAKCEYCGGELDKENSKELNLMFQTAIGPGKDSINSFLRPETAQLIFSDFRQIAMNSRLKLPFGIAQIGKAFRNEISPRNFLFRCREFEQMEIEYFIAPDQECSYEILDMDVIVCSENDQKEEKEGKKMSIENALEKGIIKRKWHAYWLTNSLNWFKEMGCNIENFRLRQHPKDELSHYSSDCWDIEYHFPFGWKELTGIADRGDYDLSKHKDFSGKKMEIHDEEKGKVLPHVVAEPSFGVERAFLVFLYEFYEDDKDRGNIVLHFPPKLSPYKVAVFPLIKRKSEFVEKARDIYDNLNKNMNAFYDESGSVGKRYARQDEIGTPFCITIDGQTLEDDTVTIRDRDSTEQTRVKIEKLREILEGLNNERINFEDL